MACGMRLTRKILNKNEYHICYKISPNQKKSRSPFVRKYTKRSAFCDSCIKPVIPDFLNLFGIISLSLAYTVDNSFYKSEGLEMLFLHDVWVNWFEGEENGYNVCHFHEWRKEDTVELLDQVPLLRVPSVLFHYIENDLSELPKGLLEDVHQKSYIRKNHERTKLEYCFVVTDGIGILAVDTIGYTIPVRKSRLIPRQEQLVYEMVKDVEPEAYEFEPKKLESSKEYHILSLAPEHVRGLTRKERQIKQLMFMALDQLKGLKNRAEIGYWYTEWNPHMYEQIKRMSFEEIWDMLYNETIEGWSDKHLAFCENLIKGQPFFEKLWEMENESKVN